MSRFWVLDQNVALAFVVSEIWYFVRALHSSIQPKWFTADRALKATLNIIVLPNASFGRCA